MTKQTSTVLSIGQHLGFVVALDLLNRGALRPWPLLLSLLNRAVLRMPGFEPVPVNLVLIIGVVPGRLLRAAAAAASVRLDITSRSSIAADTAACPVRASAAPRAATLPGRA